MPRASVCVFVALFYPPQSQCSADIDLQPTTKRGAFAEQASTPSKIALGTRAMSNNLAPRKPGGIKPSLKHTLRRSARLKKPRVGLGDLLEHENEEEPEDEEAAMNPERSHKTWVADRDAAGSDSDTEWSRPLCLSQKSPDLGRELVRFSYSWVGILSRFSPQRCRRLESMIARAHARGCPAAFCRRFTTAPVGRTCRLRILAPQAHRRCRTLME